ncbi:MAG: nucleotide sugar dehydrogenase [Pelagibacterales bacterium]|nr:nucleotide sugar dehydrogenase [Pelagibacterales bacterium]|tara:strand:- start:10048 stop:11445 length:1398 start_codon:yes stop_codon:yes gene_type:complete
MIKKYMKTICVQGLGYVGSATIAALSNASDINGNPLYNIIGIDINSKDGLERISNINKGIFPFGSQDKSLSKAILKGKKEKRIFATTEISYFDRADVIVINIPLDITWDTKEPYINFKKFKNAIYDIGNNMRENALIIVETTVPPGTCEKVVLPILLECFNSRGLNIDGLLLAHSYERVMPGPDYLDSIINYWRVFAGYNKRASDVCEKFLSSFINVKDYPLKKLSSLTASETSKVIENSYRAVNIAFMEEWGLFAESVGLNSFEIIDAIRMRPTHNNIRRPGLGVGGYCLIKDPLFGLLSSKQLYETEELAFPMSQLGININSNMPNNNLNRLNLYVGGLKGKRVLVLGATYRSEVDDVRNSPSEVLCRGLDKMGASWDIHDPFVDSFENLNKDFLQEIPAANKYDILILTVDHNFYKEFDFLDWVEGTKIIIMDTNNILTEELCKALVSKNFRLLITGRGDLK